MEDMTIRQGRSLKITYKTDEKESPQEA